MCVNTTIAHTDIRSYIYIYVKEYDEWSTKETLYFNNAITVTVSSMFETHIYINLTHKCNKIRQISGEWWEKWWSSFAAFVSIGLVFLALSLYLPVCLSLSMCSSAKQSWSWWTNRKNKFMARYPRANGRKNENIKRVQQQTWATWNRTFFIAVQLHLFEMLFLHFSRFARAIRSCCLYCCRHTLLFAFATFSCRCQSIEFSIYKLPWNELCWNYSIHILHSSTQSLVNYNKTNAGALQSNLLVKSIYWLRWFQ